MPWLFEFRERTALDGSRPRRRARSSRPGARSWDRFFDTANAYSFGESEEILGKAIAERDREELVVATKGYFPMQDGPNGQGLSRKHVLDQAQASLNRLGTDYIDLHQIHRWDEHTPITETLSTLDQLIDEGTVRYVGASTMSA